MTFHINRHHQRARLRLAVGGNILRLTRIGNYQLTGGHWCPGPQFFDHNNVVSISADHITCLTHDRSNSNERMNGKFTGGTRDPGKSADGADIAGEPIGVTINHWEGPSLRLKTCTFRCSADNQDALMSPPPCSQFLRHICNESHFWPLRSYLLYASWSSTLESMYPCLWTYQSPWNLFEVISSVPNIRPYIRRWPHLVTLFASGGSFL